MNKVRKGISLNYEARLFVNFKDFKASILPSKPLSFPNRRIEVNFLQVNIQFSKFNPGTQKYDRSQIIEYRPCEKNKNTKDIVYENIFGTMEKYGNVSNKCPRSKVISNTELGGVPSQSIYILGVLQLPRLQV